MGMAHSAPPTPTDDWTGLACRLPHRLQCLAWAPQLLHRARGSTDTLGPQVSLRKGTGRGCSFSVGQLGVCYHIYLPFVCITGDCSPRANPFPHTCDLQLPSLLCLLCTLNTQHPHLPVPWQPTCWPLRSRTHPLWGAFLPEPSPN